MVDVTHDLHMTNAYECWARLPNYYMGLLKARLREWGIDGWDGMGWCSNAIVK